VADNDEDTFEIFKIRFQCSQSIQINVVRWLVKNEKVRPLRNSNESIEFRR
jgi:hypothetical protein